MVLYNGLVFGRSHGSVGLIWLSLASSTICGVIAKASVFAFFLERSFQSCHCAGPGSGRMAVGKLGCCKNTGFLCHGSLTLLDLVFTDHALYLVPY